MFLAIFGRKKVSKKTVEIWAFESFGFNPNTSVQSFTIERFGFQVSRGGCWEVLKMPMSARTARIFARYGVCASLWWFLPHLELFFFSRADLGALSLSKAEIGKTEIAFSLDPTKRFC